MFELEFLFATYSMESLFSVDVLIFFVLPKSVHLPKATQYDCHPSSFGAGESLLVRLEFDTIIAFNDSL